MEIGLRARFIGPIRKTMHLLDPEIEQRNLTREHRLLQSAADPGKEKGTRKLGN